MKINRKEFLKEFREYTESVLKWNDSEYNLEITTEQMVENINEMECPFNFRNKDGFSSYLFISRNDNGEWSHYIEECSHQFVEYSDYYHRWKRSKKFKAQLLKILEEL